MEGSQHAIVLRQLLEQVLLPPSSVRLEQRIGAGAFGEVFKGALHGAPCAVKTMKQPVSKDAVVAFRKEILISSQLRHPNVVEFKGACWGGDLTALILGWCSGGSLEDVLQQKDLEWADPLLRLATDVARGMAYLHGMEVVHRTPTGRLERGVFESLRRAPRMVSERARAINGLSEAAEQRGIHDPAHLRDSVQR